jgi:hypothetical protein
MASVNCWRGTTGRAAVVRSVGSVGFVGVQVAAGRKDSGKGNRRNEAVPQSPSGMS